MSISQHYSTLGITQIEAQCCIAPLIVSLMSLWRTWGCRLEESDRDNAEEKQPSPQWSCSQSLRTEHPPANRELHALAHNPGDYGCTPPFSRHKSQTWGDLEFFRPEFPAFHHKPGDNGFSTTGFVTLSKQGSKPESWKDVATVPVTQSRVWLFTSCSMGWSPWGPTCTSR
jgi:hypothetical protein